MKDFFELRENKDKFIVKYSMSKKGPIRQMPFHLLAYAKKFLADKEKEGYKGIISKGGKPVKESVELDEAKLSDMGIHNKIKDRNLLIKAIKTAETMGGNMTGAVREIEKMQKGLSKHKAVQAALRQANESTE